MNDHCEAETIELPETPFSEPRFEVRCKKHGVIATYNALTVRQIGVRALQFKLDVAWVTHAASPWN